MSAWTRDAALNALDAFVEKHGYQPITKEAGAANGLPSWAVVARLFGSWNAWIEAAGLRPYPAKSSALAKTLAYRDRHPNWRQELSASKKRRMSEHDEVAA